MGDRSRPENNRAAQAKSCGAALTDGQMRRHPKKVKKIAEMS
jgi:hypothetical protein